MSSQWRCSISPKRAVDYCCSLVNFCLSATDGLFSPRFFQISLLSQLRHPNIVSILGIIDCDESGGKSLTRKDKQGTDQEFLFPGIVMGMQFQPSTRKISFFRIHLFCRTVHRWRFGRVLQERSHDSMAKTLRHCGSAGQR